jgi:iron(III) transport system ATP-binding protein
MADVTLSKVSKRFGDTVVLDEIDLEIAAGSFAALLGPSGCGKTTLLRIIAGLERPSGGTVAIGGSIVAGSKKWVPTEDRHLGMVFQSYALWPHMNVAENVAFGLAVRRVGRKEGSERLERALAAVGLEGLGGRRIAQLSGGQRQRAALARCLVLEPSLILLDEPLANLDAHLRLQMQAEFRRIHRETGTTFVFVTHDQVEAMALADSVTVMNAGRIEQTGRPEELYRHPATPMVAGFFGKGVVLPVDVVASGDGRVSIAVGGHIFELSSTASIGPALLSARPGDIALQPTGTGIEAVAVDSFFRGEDYLVSLALPALGDMRIEVGMPTPPEPGDRLSLGIRSGSVIPATRR